MAYSRTLVFRSPLLSWQQVRLDAPHPAWSDEFRVDAPCLLMPLTRCFECRIDANRFVCDPASALWLSSSQPYRLRRPWSDQRSALLVVANDVGASRRCSVPLGAHVAMSRWWRQLETNCVESVQIEEALVEMVASLLPDAEVRTARPHRAVERAREYIAAEPQRDDSLTDIAKAANCSAFHLARQFRQLTGQSLHGFRTRLRMTLALDRLRQGERDLNTLAAELGYVSHSHFSGVFRRTFGITPSQMRTNLAAPSLA